MKPTILTIVLAAAAGPMLNAQEQLPMRDAVTHDQLVLQSRKATQNDPMLRMTPSTGGDPAKVNQPGDLLANSDVVCFGGRATLVPKRAILRIPPALADRIKIQPGAKVQSWAEFLTANRGWITTLEVTRPQAEGNEPVAEETAARIAESDKLVVATYQGGPISVLPPKPAETAAATTQTTPDLNQP